MRSFIFSFFFCLFLFFSFPALAQDTGGGLALPPPEPAPVPAPSPSGGGVTVTTTPGSDTSVNGSNTSGNDSGDQTSDFPTIVCGATKGITGILPSSTVTFEHLSTSVEGDLPFLGSTLIADMLYDLYVVLKLVLSYKTLKIIGGKL